MFFNTSFSHMQMVENVIESAAVGLEISPQKATYEAQLCICLIFKNERHLRGAKNILFWIVA